MDLHLKQWGDNQKNESELERHPSAKIPRLLFETIHHHHDNNHNNFSEEKFEAPALPLFVPEPANSNKLNGSTNLSTAYTSDCSTRFPRAGGGYFSMAQWQELELQAVIFRHMMAGAAVPPELLQLVKKSLLNSPSYYFHHHSLQQNYPFYQPTLLQAAAGYWGRGSMDPEPGRCRRTDGKKWRCSRDVVPGQKYCERHVHRGRNRSRKPVEFPTNTPIPITTNSVTGSALCGGSGGDANSVGVGLGTALKTANKYAAASQLAAPNSGSQFAVSGPNAPIDILQLNQGSTESNVDKKGFFNPQHEASGDHGTSSGRVLRHFFDDWPRGSNSAGNSTGLGDSTTCLSISTPGGANNSTSDFLKLSTGNGDDNGRRVRDDNGESGGGQQSQRVQGQLNWNSVVGWGTANHQMGGPLAEALRSSTSATNNSSPTSVLHQLQRCSATADASYVTA